LTVGDFLAATSTFGFEAAISFTAGLFSITGFSTGISALADLPLLGYSGSASFGSWTLPLLSFSFETTAFFADAFVVAAGFCSWRLLALCGTSVSATFLVLDLDSRVTTFGLSLEAVACDTGFLVTALLNYSGTLAATGAALPLVYLLSMTAGCGLALADTSAFLLADFLGSAFCGLVP